MKEYQEAMSVEEVSAFRQLNRFAFVYVSREDCGICHAVWPQVRELLADFPQIRLLKVDADVVPAVAGELSVFTVPALLFYVDGREMVRKARFVVMTELEHQLRQITTNYVEDL